MIAMVWDLRGALLKKEERESARLMDFAFRLRARTWRLIAEALDDDAEQAARLTAKHDDEGLLALLAQRHPHRAADLTTLYRDCEAAARRQLIAERGDPSPYRLL
jgi:hypothetical protein